jgi:hypothetical protein
MHTGERRRTKSHYEEDNIQNFRKVVLSPEIPLKNE